jgi:hypothetical protein
VKERRELVCVALYLCTGIDLRLMEGEDIRQTDLFEWAHLLQARARTSGAPG